MTIKLKYRVAEGLLDFVDHRYPRFKGLVDYCEVSTPLTVEHFTGHRMCIGVWHTRDPGAFPAAVSGVSTPVRNLYLTGADVASLGIDGRDEAGGVATTARCWGVWDSFGSLASL